MRAFFANGTLPAEGTVCAIDPGEGPFPNVDMKTAGGDVKALVAESSPYREAVRNVAAEIHGMGKYASA